LPVLNRTWATLCMPHQAIARTGLDTGAHQDYGDRHESPLFHSSFLLSFWFV